MDEPKLPGTGTRRVRGRHRRALTDTLRAWRGRDHLTGPGSQAVRIALQGLADAADAAEHSDSMSPYAVSMTVERYLRAVDEHAPAPAPPANPYEVPVELASRWASDTA